MAMNNNTNIPEVVKGALSNGRKVQAIKALREAHGIGLKEAKERVEAYINSQPKLKEQYASNNISFSQERIIQLIVVMVIIFGAYSFLG